MLSFFLTSWRDQYEAMLRAASRLESLEKSKAMTTAHDFGEGYMDELAHFFMDAWHLRDWIAADKEIPKAMRRAIAAHVQSSEVLTIAGELADRAKHRAAPRTGRPASEVGFFSFRIGRP